MITREALEVRIDGERVPISAETLEKYNRPGPRYTSYPTAPEWDASFGPEDARESYRQANAGRAPVSLYFHLPFCRSLCLYCGCNVVISKNREVANTYLHNLKQEIDWVSAEMAPGRRVEQLHWGGGTPTYLSSDQIEDLYGYIRERFSFSPDAEVSIEIDPRATTSRQLEVMRRLGFNRVSLGIQDFNSLVQETIHRVQPYEMTRDIFDRSRALGYESINVDLIYGLPHQTAESFGETVEKIIGMSPDRIAVFSYAHVPWMKKQQGSFARFLPESLEKFRIFSRAIEMLTGAGYRYIGLDHFARPEDEISRAQQERTLHRNFQGYTTKAGCDLYGMGVSSISGLEDVYAQNERELPRYYEAIAGGRWPTIRGFRLSQEDKLRRSIINRILCHCVVVKSEVERDFGIPFDGHFERELEQLRELEREGLVRLSGDSIQVAPLGRVFIRNVAMVFDAYLGGPEQRQERLFSKTL
ncbi:MAG TPA: oxygen-independent coproporphyrinogen III oxidase [Blastocatellia bacterium]|nr:oxygen-independent coproporphyrinogen III oxidase [Blastocatellia bacterium]